MGSPGAVLASSSISIVLCIQVVVRMLLSEVNDAAEIAG